MRKTGNTVRMGTITPVPVPVEEGVVLVLVGEAEGTTEEVVVERVGKDGDVELVVQRGEVVEEEGKMANRMICLGECLRMSTRRSIRGIKSRSGIGSARGGSGRSERVSWVG